MPPLLQPSLNSTPPRGAMTDTPLQVRQHHTGMRVDRIIERRWRGLALLLLSLAVSGCSAIFQSAVDTADYNQRYHDWRSSGLSEKEADRKAFEGNFFHDP
jgi:hypothetical protein